MRPWRRKDEGAVRYGDDFLNNLAEFALKMMSKTVSMIFVRKTFQTQLTQLALLEQQVVR
jgi:hypothetical protein